MMRASSCAPVFLFFVCCTGCGGGDEPLPENPATTPGGDLHHAYAVVRDAQCDCDPEGDYLGCPEFVYADWLPYIACADEVWASYEMDLGALAACHEGLMLEAGECIRAQGCGALGDCLAAYESGQDSCSGPWLDLAPFNGAVQACVTP